MISIDLTSIQEYFLTTLVELFTIHPMLAK